MSSLAVQTPFVQASTLVNVFYAVIDGINQLAVDARELHKFLKVGRDFSNWIKGRISEYKFSENLDFISFRQTGRKPKGGRPTIEYHLTLDMAKELAMVENNDEGRKVRRYFIRCEKELYKTDSEQRRVLVSACVKYCAGSSINISQVYKTVGEHFGYSGGIVNIPAPLLPEAVAYVYGEILARQSSPSQQTRDDTLNDILAHAYDDNYNYIQLVQMLSHLPFVDEQRNGYLFDKLRGHCKDIVAYAYNNGLKTKTGKPIFELLGNGHRANLSTGVYYNYKQ